MSNNSREAVIVSAVRTPIGGFKGALASLSASDLGAVAVRAAVERAGVEPASIDEALMGNVVLAGQGQAPARQAAIKAGLPPTVGATTINKICGSGLKTVMLAAAMIATGDGDVFVAGGMESMNNGPYMLPQARFGYRLGDGKLVDAMVHDGLWCAFENHHMGNSAEVPRRDTSLEKLACLRPAFDPDGIVTAGNSPGITDGAAATVVMSRERAEELGVRPLARVVAYDQAAVEPLKVFTAPIFAVRKLLVKTGTSVDDYDLVEMNEAFAAQCLADGRELGLDWDKVNVNGGAIALGHPIGCSGARVLVTLIYALRQRGLERGLATLCLGGGEAVALAIELE
ncbi:MAG: acetyl-CoA acetyltransferase [Anaerolineaceae bacterium 4572_32.2]|nr:MAG: acetyl-CoA acetyltransferase [Anaerolineaceae bacterium 4572_32.2]